MLTDLDQFYLPNLHTFRNKNTFYGSLDELRFQVAAPGGGRRTRRTPSPSAPGRGVLPGRERDSGRGRLSPGRDGLPAAVRLAGAGLLPGTPAPVPGRGSVSDYRFPTENTGPTQRSAA